MFMPQTQGSSENPTSQQFAKKLSQRKNKGGNTPTLMLTKLREQPLAMGLDRIAQNLLSIDFKQLKRNFFK